jgi:serine/threonine protein kinase
MTPIVTRVTNTATTSATPVSSSIVTRSSTKSSLTKPTNITTKSNKKTTTSTITNNNNNNNKTVKNTNTPTIQQTITTNGTKNQLSIGANKRLNLDIMDSSNSNSKSKKSLSSPQLEKQRNLNLLASKSATTTITTTTTSKFQNKKRIISNEFSNQIHDDNDHDEDSSFECYINLENNNSKLNKNNNNNNNTCQITTTTTIQNKKTNKVSFQESSSTTVNQQKQKRQTPPHKKFRKLRLFDTPHTPKTLIKKSNLLIASSSSAVVNVTPTVVQDNKKIKISNKNNSTKKNNNNIIQTEHNVTQKEEETKKIIKNNEKFSTPPKISEELEIASKENVNQTPKTSRRTPVSVLKAPMPSNMQLSPTCYNSIDANMDVDIDNNNKEILEFNNLIRYSFNKSSNPSNRKLFEHNNLLRNNMNKKLQFDDSDNEDSSSCCSSSYAGEIIYKKTLVNNRSYSNDPTTICEEEMKSASTLRAISTLSTSSSALSFEPVGSSLTNIDNHHNFNHFGSQNLSYSSNSLFRPMSRFVNHYNNTNSLSSNNLFCGSCNSVGSSSSNNNNNNNNLNSNTSNYSGSTRSPKSPFQFNQLHANINPFTPTNSFNSSNIISNKLKNASVTSSSNSLPGLNDLLNSNKTQLVENNNRSNLIKQNQPSFKRCYEEQNCENEYHNNNHEIEECSNNNNNNQTNLNNSLKNNEQNSDLQSSLPKNKRLALRQCLVSRYHEEFHEVCKLGSGEFGDVFKCINRLDGCTYAIKRSKKPIAGSALEIAAWKEVCAHAVLVKHNNIVQYYSAWAEADRMLIQNEYCNGGSLAEFIESLKINNLISSSSPPEIIAYNNSPTQQSQSDVNSKSDAILNEHDLKILLLHVAKGLSYMHSLNLVHLDIKPGNIFICRSPRRVNQHQNNQDLDSISSQSSLSNMGGIVINEESGIESDELEDDVTDLLSVTNSNASKQTTNENKSKTSSKSIFSEIITYKIGDLGHVTSTLDPHVEEGDCRYLPNEILQEQYDHLTKADVFALALTVFVCGSFEELPKNGDEWHSIRQGNLKPLNQCSERFNKLLTVIKLFINFSFK